MSSRSGPTDIKQKFPCTLNIRLKETEQLHVDRTNRGERYRRTAFERKLTIAAWVKELGFPLTLNTVLHRENLDHVADIVALGFDEPTVRRVVAMVDQNEYKRRQGPIGIKITPRAFGKDWRLPIVNGFRE